MKIQLIGTGAIPAIQNSASVLINEHILFDIPNGTLKAMLRQNVDILKIDTVIISHTHADHCFDIPFLLWYRKNFEKDKKEESLKIITDQETRKTIEKLIELSHFDSAKNAKKEFIDFKEVGKIKPCDELEITNEPMQHVGIQYANGYRLKDEKISIALTGDTCMCEGVRKLASNLDILISDMTLEEGDDSHMGIDKIVELQKEYPNLKIIPIHMYPQTRDVAEKMKLKNVNILNDGDVIEV